MSKHAITDFFVELGFDAKKVVSGLNKLEGDFNKFSKKLNLNHKVDFKISQAAAKAKADLKTHTKDTKNKLQELADKEVKIVRAKQAEIESIVAKSQDKIDKKNRNALEAFNKSIPDNKVNSNADKIKAKEVKLTKEQVRKEREALILARKRSAEAQRLNNIRAKRSGLKYTAERRSSQMQGSLTDGGSKGILEDIKNSKEYKSLLEDQEKLLRRISKARTSADFKRIGTEMAKIKDRQTDIIRKDREMRQGFRQTSFAVQSMTQSIRNMATSYLSVYAIIRGGQETLRKGMQIQSAKVGLIMGTGSVEAAAEEYEFLTEMAYKYGASVDEMVLSYGKISAGAKSAGLSTEQLQEVFVQLNDAAIGFSLTSQEMQGVFKAITDSFSKGTLMSEELKGQLGDRMPVAINAMANALEVSTEELFRMMENGELVASETIPKLTRGLQDLAISSGALTAGMKTSSKEMDRTRTKFQLLIAEMYDSGMEEGLAEFFKMTRSVLNKSSPLFQALGRIFGAFSKLAGAVLMLSNEMIRPLTIALNQLTGSFDIASGKLGFLTKGFLYLALAITYPFELLERFNDWSEKKKGIWGFGAAAIGVGLFAGKAYVLNKILGFVFGEGRMARWLSGWGLIVNLAKAAWYPFAKLGQAISWLFSTRVGDGIAWVVIRLPKVIKGVIGIIRAGFTLISKHPLIAALLALAGFIAAPFQDKTKDLAARYQEEGSGKIMSWAKAIGVAGAENTVYGATGGLYSPEWVEKAGRSQTTNKQSSVTNNINITGHSPEDVANKIMPMVKGEINTTTSNIFMSNMSAQE